MQNLLIRVVFILVLCLPGTAHAAEIVVKSASTILTFLLFSSTDHLTGKTGATLTCKLSKNGASGATTTNSASEIDATNLPGRYKLTLTTTETNTAGPLDMDCTATGADPMSFHAFVYDPATANFGSNLVNILGTVASTPATAGILDVNVKNWNNSVVGSLQAFPTNFSVTSIDTNGRLDLSKVNGSAINNLIGGRVDATLGGVTFPTNFSLIAVDASGRLDLSKINGLTLNNPISGRVDSNIQAAASSLTTNITGSITNVTGSVGSVAGNVVGSIGSISGVTFPTNFGGQLISGTGLTASSTYRKNTAGQPVFPIFIRDSTNTQIGKIGLTLTVTVSKDTAAFTSATGTATEISSGWYTFAPSQADLNCNTCIFRVTGGAGAVEYGYYITTTQ